MSVHRESSQAFFDSTMTAPKGEAYNPPEICISTTVTLRLEQQKKCYYNCEVPMRGGNFELVLNQSQIHIYLRNYA